MPQDGDRDRAPGPGSPDSVSEPAPSAELLRAILDGVPAMLSYWDRDQRNVLANAAYREYFGLAPGQITGMSIRELLGDEMFERNRPHIEGALAGERQLFDREMVDISGRVRHAQAQYIPNLEDGEVRGFFVLVADVTARVTAEREARRGLSRLRALVHSVPGGFVLQFDDQLRFEVADGEALETFGYDRDALEGHTLHEALSPELAAELEPRYLAALAGETRSWNRDIGARTFSLTCGPVRDEDGSVFGGAVVCTDTTAQRRASAIDRTLHAVARTVASNADLPDVAGTIVRQLDDLFGFTLCTVVRFDRGGQGTVLATSREADFLVRPLALDRDDGTANARVALTGTAAKVVFDPGAGEVSAGAFGAGLRASAAAPIYVRGRLWGSVGVATDDPGDIDDELVTRLSSFADLVELAIANTDAWEALTERAANDSMTGLLNRASFDQRLALEVTRSQSEGTPLGLAMIDIDNFKNVNDTFGHQVGDDVLLGIVERLLGSVREGDVLARVGGEEFAWILPGATPEQAWHATERAREAVALRAHGSAGGLTISIGVAALGGQVAGPGLLYLAADRALYAAKRWGRNRTILSGGLDADVTRAGRAGR